MHLSTATPLGESKRRVVGREGGGRTLGLTKGCKISRTKLRNSIAACFYRLTVKFCA